MQEGVSEREKEGSPELSERQFSMEFTLLHSPGKMTEPLGFSFHGRLYREQPWKRSVSVARAEGRFVCSLSQRYVSSQDKGLQGWPWL